MKSDTASNKLIVKRWLEQGFNQRNLAVFLEPLAEDFIHHGHGLDLEQFKASRRVVFKELHPASQVSINDIIAEGDKVAVRLTYAEHERQPQLELLLFNEG